MSDGLPAEVVEACAGAGALVVADGARVSVTLARPDVRNAQTPALWHALAGLGDAVAAAPHVRVVVLRATGPSFSAGLDRALLGPGTPEQPGLAAMAAWDDERLDAEIEGFQRGFTWWRRVDAVTVAAVQGHAVGAGFQLALACDLRVVADDVSFAMLEPSLGLVPDLGGTAPLVAALGYPRALEVCATGRSVGAAEAVGLGLAEVAVPAGELDGCVDDLVAALVAAPAGAVAATKHLLRDAGERGRGQQLAAERAAQRDRLRALAGSRPS